jgi:hypothetical protein
MLTMGFDVRPLQGLAAHTMLSRVVHRAGGSSTQDPGLRRLSGYLCFGRQHPAVAQGDILLALPGGVTIADISVIHPLSINTHPAGETMASAAASRRDRQKQATYAQMKPCGFSFMRMLFSVESYELLGQPALQLLHALADDAAGPGRVNGAFFVVVALCELNVGLCMGIFSCTVHVWEYLQSPVGRASKLACVCIQGSRGCVDFLLVLHCLLVMIMSMSKFRVPLWMY